MVKWYKDPKFLMHAIDIDKLLGMMQALKRGN